MKDTIEQEAFYDAVNQTDQHLLLMASAGTGKSTTLKRGLHRKRGINRQSCLFTAFNKSTKDEMVGQLPENIKVTTSHAFGLSQLLKSPLYSADNIDKNKVHKIIESTLNTQKWRSTYRPKQKDKITFRCVKAVSMAKNMMISDAVRMEELIEDLGIRLNDYPELPELCVEVMRKSNKSKFIDFDDMLYLPAYMGLKGEIDIRKFDITIADEAQDFSKSQQTLIDLACGDRMFAAGDLYQSINAFRGADSANFSKLSQRENTVVLPLTTTWRCSRLIVEMAQQYNPNIYARDGAPDGIIDSALSTQDANFGDMIIGFKNLPIIRECIGLIKEGKRASVLGDEFKDSIKKLIRDTKHTSTIAVIGRINRAFDKLYDDRVEQVGEERAKREKWLKILNEKRSLAIHFCEQTDTAKNAIALVDRVFDNKYDDIICSTIHKAKGKEANRVFITEYEELATSAQKDEQMRNLAYVGVTRAKNHLTLLP